MGASASAYQGENWGCWMWENTLEKLSVSLGLISKQYADGGIDSVLLEMVTSARQAGTCRRFFNCNFSDVTQSQSNVQNSVISRLFFANKVSN